MSSIDLRKVELSSERKLSWVGLSHYLRMGFLPAPLSVFSNEAVENVYGGGLADEFDAGSRSFHRNLRQFVGSRPVDPIRAIGVDEAIDEMEKLLLASTARAAEGADRVFLMASGGKDSLSVAWALRELGVDATLLHCTNRGRENESEHVQSVAELLGFPCIMLSDDIELVDSYMRERSANLPLCIGDPAFFAYVRAVREISNTVGGDEKVRITLLDGMGNDGYMGHIAPKRERRLTELPQLPLLTEGVASLFAGNQFLHYAIETLFAPRPERHFSGAFFAVGSQTFSPDVERIFKAYAAVPWERRSLLRGGIFDIDCCMRKGVIAAALDPRVQVSFPFLDKKLIELFERVPEDKAFDFDNVINKKILRRWLDKRGVTSQFISSAKGSFRFNLDGLPSIYRPSASLMEILSSLGINPESIKKIHGLSTTSFVAAQKLALLYCLEMYLKPGADIPAFDKADSISIHYTD